MANKIASGILETLLEDIGEGTLRKALKREGVAEAEKVSLQEVPTPLLEKVQQSLRGKEAATPSAPELAPIKAVSEPELPLQQRFLGAAESASPAISSGFEDIPGSAMQSPGRRSLMDSLRQHPKKTAAAAAGAATGAAALYDAPSSLPPENPKPLPTPPPKAAVTKQPESQKSETAPPPTTPPKTVPTLDAYTKLRQDWEKTSSELSPAEKEAFAQKTKEFETLRQEARKAAKETNDRTAMAEVAGIFGQALSQLGAGLYGLKHKVDMSGVKFNLPDWSKEYDRTADSLKQSLADIQSGERLLSGEKELAERKAERGAESQRRLLEKGFDAKSRAEEKALDREAMERAAQLRAETSKEVAGSRAAATTDKTAQRLAQIQNKARLSAMGNIQDLVTEPPGTKASADKRKLILEALATADIDVTDEAIFPKLDQGIVEFSDANVDWKTGLKNLKALPVAAPAAAAAPEAAPSKELVRIDPKNPGRKLIYDGTTTPPKFLRYE